jgi:hypothetical protein
MKWVPLLVISGGTGISAGLVVAFALTVACVKQTGQTTRSLVATASRVNHSRFLKLLLAHC